jgi:hypothetical protein
LLHIATTLQVAIITAHFCVHALTRRNFFSFLTLRLLSLSVQSCSYQHRQLATADHLSIEPELHGGNVLALPSRTGALFQLTLAGKM